MADIKTGRINPQFVEYQRHPVRLLHFTVSSSPGICCLSAWQKRQDCMQSAIAEEQRSVC